MFTQTSIKYFLKQTMLFLYIYYKTNIYTHSLALNLNVRVKRDTLLMFGMHAD